MSVFIAEQVVIDANSVLLAVLIGLVGWIGKRHADQLENLVVGLAKIRETIAEHGAKIDAHDRALEKIEN